MNTLTVEEKATLLLNGQIEEALKLMENDNSADYTFVASNPPYQYSTGTPTTSGRDSNVVSVFPCFYDLVADVSIHGSVIIPGGRWMQRAKGYDGVANRIFASAISIDWFPHGEESSVVPLFPGVAIPDGVAVVTVNNNNETPNHLELNGIAVNRPKHKEILPLSRDAVNIVETIFAQGYNSLNMRRCKVNAFGLPTNWVEQNSDAVRNIHEGPGDFIRPVRAYLGNSIPGKQKRVQEYWIDGFLLDWTSEKTKLMESWKVLSSQGQISKRPATSSYRVVDNEHIVGASWLMVGTFATEEEANNYKAYIDTDFVRYLLEESRGGKSARWGVFVPDLGDYSSNNPHIRWNRPLEPQLYKMFGLTQEQIATITDTARKLTGSWRSSKR
jgi:hypothetical protein